jgi:hypothetical protein
MYVVFLLLMGSSAGQDEKEFSAANTNIGDKIQNSSLIPDHKADPKLRDSSTCTYTSLTSQ